MTVDFGRLLTPTQRARLAAERSEILRLYALPDRWLGEELLRLARRLRDDFPAGVAHPPEAAQRSGAHWGIAQQSGAY